ncbi:hypothetical protein BJX99DRAFT_220771 [Aspergillus californicus]
MVNNFVDLTQTDSDSEEQAQVSSTPSLFKGVLRESAPSVFLYYLLWLYLCSTATTFGCQTTFF